MKIESKGKLGYSATITSGESFAGFTRMEAIGRALKFIFGRINEAKRLTEHND